jgi:hypothetical protein
VSPPTNLDPAPSSNRIAPSIAAGLR